MKTPLIYTELVDKRDALELLRSEWDALACEDTRDGFFRTATWYLAWLDHIETKSEPFVITARDDNGRLVGLAPLCRTQHVHRGVTFTAIKFGGQDIVAGDYLDFLTRDNRPLVVQAILNRLWTLRPQWSLFLLSDMLTDSDLQTEVQSWAKNKNVFIHRLYDSYPCVFIQLPGIFQNYLDTLSKSLRKTIRRWRRSLVKEGGPRIIVYTEPDEVVAHLDDLIYLHEARWKQLNLPGMVGKHGFPEFLREVISSPNTQSRLYFLTHNNQLVAAQLVFCFGKSVLDYQTGRDPNSILASDSPGLILLQRSIQDSIEDGFRYYDTLRGDEEYKTHWTKTTRTMSTLIVVRSPLARMWFRIVEIVRWVKGPKKQS